MIYEVTLTDLRSEGAVVEAKAFLEGELLAEVEIVFAHLDNSRSNQIFGPKNFVFTQQLLGVLDLAKARERARLAEEEESASSADADDHDRSSETRAATTATVPTANGRPESAEGRAVIERSETPVRLATIGRNAGKRRDRRVPTSAAALGRLSLDRLISTPRSASHPGLGCFGRVFHAP